MTQAFERRTDAILRLPQVRQITGLSRSSIYAMQDSHNFPHSIKLSPRAVGWLLSRANERDAGQVDPATATGLEALRVHSPGVAA
jgi:prophage regulatory protein